MSQRAGVAILGLGASGFSAAQLALQKGENVHVSDLRTDSVVGDRARRLRELGAAVELGSHDVPRIATARVVVVSPGIPPDAPALVELRRRSVVWVSEPEFAARYFQGPLIAVTGTNGKTTTTLLTAHLLDAAGIRVAVGGNVGEDLAPAASELALLEPAPEWYVLEMSSFQLADTAAFAPRIGVVTTLAPDHLDRYRSTREYYADKARLFRNATPESRWVLNGESEAVRALPGDAPGVRCYFARAAADTDGALPAAYTEEGVLCLRPGWTGVERLIRTGELPLSGGHQVMNALAASLTARLAGADPEGIRRGLREFRGPPHRMEVVAERNGIRWINDSKATNVEAARSALLGLDRPVVAILGGKDKGEDFRPLVEALTGRVRAVVLYGEAGPRLREELQGEGGEGAAIPLHLVADGFDEAVAVASGAARRGDAILLTPACSSFDLFVDYRARGHRFRELALAAPDSDAGRGES
ncbi:MAG: UDP-N-acetylmuramoyl-L-alanine--D-glutamate ligase [Gemmatimonadota bacterium]